MRKIGRNNPCPCGSGKKYKKCCLLKDDSEKSMPKFIMGDAASNRMQYLLLTKMNKSEFLRAYKGPALRIERAVLAHLPLNYVFNKSESEKILLLWKEKLEEKIKKLCSTHSKYFWLFLSRRIFPESPEEYDRPGTPYLHRVTFNLAVLKYGKNTQIDEFVTVPDSFDWQHYVTTEEPYIGETVDADESTEVEIESADGLRGVNKRPVTIPRQITLVDALQVYQIEYLSFDYYMITAQLRRLWKGGKVKVHSSRFSGVVLPKKVDELVRLYDERQAKYTRLLSTFGSITNLEVIKENKMVDEFVLTVPILNIEKHEVPLVFPGEEFFEGKIKGPLYFKPNPANYVPVPISIRSFYEKMCMFRHAIEEIFNFLPEEIVAFIISLGRHNDGYWVNNIQSRYNFFQRGYTLLPSTEDFQQYLTKVFIYAYRRLFGDTSQKLLFSSCKRLIDRFTYKVDDFERINLWDRIGLKLFLPVKKGLLIDYSAIPTLFSSIFDELSILASIDGRVGQVRGNDFEYEVEGYLKLNVQNYKPWKCHRKLKFLSGTEREIDVSFWLKNALFVVECKALALPSAFDRGEPRALKARKQKLDAALNQVDTLCELLCKERKGKNFELPATVTHIISIAASPFPEYIGKRTDHYFLKPSVPRVCTPEEIATFARSFQLSLHISKPFVWEVAKIS